MHWDWATFGVGVFTGLLLGFLVAGGGLLLFAKGMSDVDE
jgi:hypothetical protein